MRHGIADLGREHQVEAAGARMTVHGADERCAEIEAGEQRRRDAAQALEALVVDALPTCEALRGGDRGLHVHAGAEDPVAGAGQHRAADLRIAGNAAPGGREVAEGGWVERVRLRGAVDGDDGHVRVVSGELEVRRHGDGSSLSTVRPAASTPRPRAPSGARSVHRRHGAPDRAPPR